MHSRPRLSRQELFSIGIADLIWPDLGKCVITSVTINGLAIPPEAFRICRQGLEPLEPNHIKPNTNNYIQVSKGSEKIVL